MNPPKLALVEGSAVRHAPPPPRQASPPGIDWSREQEQAIVALRDWWAQGRPEIRIGGLAGTGKTTLANHLPELLGIDRMDVAYCAYTGKAASRLAMGTTIHRLMYRPRGYHCDGCPARYDSNERCHSALCEECGVSFERVESLDCDLVIVDEASMVDERIYGHLTEFGVPVIWIGDHGQLPPVKGKFNLMSTPDVRLETIHRQAEGSPILRLAMRARNAGSVPYGQFGEGVAKIRRNTLPDSRKLALLRGADMILCGRNSTRQQMNHWARIAHDFDPAAGPQPGETLVCLRNDYEVGAFNGILAEVVACEDAVSRWELEVRINGAEETQVVLALKEQFGSQRTLSEESRNVALWDYGYCLTVHKAQGSEAESVLLMEQPIGERHRWLYTGITRAKKALTIIG